MVSPFSTLPPPVKNPLLDKTASSMDKISSGNAFSSAAENPAAVAQLMGMSAEISGLQQATRNTMDASNLMRTAEGGTEGTSDALMRMRELAIKASSDTFSDADRGLMQTEMDRLMERVDQIAGSTEFNGRNLLDGSEGSLTFQVGTGSDAANQVNFQTQDMSADALGVGGASVESAADAQSLVDTIDGALEQVGEFRAEIGAGQNQLSTSTDNLMRATEATAMARSRMGDTDIASESTAMATSLVQQQIQIAMRAQGNASSSAVMRLLG
ncbi:MAG: flagellin [Myxococcota bacterium]|nr:flagellin [Myxococcota bacterium]